MFESGDIFASLSSQALLVGLATTRISVAFLLLPVFTGELIPPMVRNSIFVAFGLIAIILQPALSAAAFTSQDWILLFAKEAFIGGAIGIFFGIILWSFEAAGQVIDTQIGATMAQVVDPLSGHQTSLTGAFLGRLANFIFMAAGGLLMLVGVLMESYVFWPIGQVWPDLTRLSITLFEAEFSTFLQWVLLLSAPVLVILFIIDGVMGLINRYAQQLNVFFLSLSIKALSATAILLLMLTSIVQVLLTELNERSAALPELLHRLFSS